MGARASPADESTRPPEAFENVRKD
jgi:hypothetical protein